MKIVIVRTIMSDLGRLDPGAGLNVVQERADSWLKAGVARPPTSEEAKHIPDAILGLPSALTQDGPEVVGAPEVPMTRVVEVVESDEDEDESEEEEEEASAPPSPPAPQQRRRS